MPLPEYGAALARRCGGGRRLLLGEILGRTHAARKVGGANRVFNILLHIFSLSSLIRLGFLLLTKNGPKTLAKGYSCNSVLIFSRSSVARAVLQTGLYMANQVTHS